MTTYRQDRRISSIAVEAVFSSAQPGFSQTRCPAIATAGVAIVVGSWGTTETLAQAPTADVLKKAEKV